MGKILFFILGLLGGLALASVMYLQGATKFNQAIQTTSPSRSAANLNEAQLFWPLYRLDTQFQSYLKEIEARGSKGNGGVVIIFIKDQTNTDDVEGLINQLEVMEGVDTVQFNTLSDPKKYIQNLNSLPKSEKEIKDYIVVYALSKKGADEAAELSEVQDFVENVTINN